MTWELQDHLLFQLFSFLLVFTRIGTAIMVMPGIGELFVPTRVRLGFALAIAMILTPVVARYLPQEVPSSIVAVATLLALESFTGLFMGLIARLLMNTMHIAGMIIAMMSSLGAAQQFDPSQGAQGTAFGNFLSMTGLVLFFILDLHHVFLAGLADSYTLFTPGHFLPVQDFAFFIAKMVSGIFEIAVKISMPQILIGLMLYFVSGVLSRLMPQMQVFFIVLPLQILAAIFVMIATLSAMMLWYMEYVENTLMAFLAP